CRRSWRRRRRSPDILPISVISWRKPSDLQERVMKGSSASLLAGVLALIGGLAALIFPFIASLAVTGLVGGAFLIAGARGLFASFSDRQLPSPRRPAALSL